jgi:hypothetical protein
MGGERVTSPRAVTGVEGPGWDLVLLRDRDVGLLEDERDIDAGHHRVVALTRASKVWNSTPASDAKSESEKFLDKLNAWACQGNRVYYHQREVGDVVAWDNRRLMHQATPWNMKEPRRMLHTRIAGDGDGRQLPLRRSGAPLLPPAQLEVRTARLPFSAM